MQERSGHKDGRRGDGTAAKEQREADTQKELSKQTDASSEVTEGASSPSPPSVAEMEARTRAAEEQVRNMQSRFEEIRNDMQRQFDDTRERLNRSADERALGSKAQFVTALLPVFDNLNRSLEAAREGGSTEALLHGLERTVRGFESALAGIGVEPIRSVGEVFDPEMHEAVDTVGAQGVDDNIVTREYSRGYKMGERLLRPARVQVARSGAA